ncbi:hypothetical protein F5X99DRAFT_406705 [Biscogniauxia marginata]|nr:hypothetical protein F5X99DRAFT_406705 [Biscogniauxia marginata]
MAAMYPPSMLLLRSRLIRTRKSISFYMSVLALILIVLITSWDATSLAVALLVIMSQLQGTTLESLRASISLTLGIAITQPIYVSVSDGICRKTP